MSLSPIGDLMIAIKADVDDFHKSMRTGKEVTSTFAVGLRNAARGVRNLGAVMTAAGAVAAGVLNKMAQRAIEVRSAYREVNTLTNKSSNAFSEYAGTIRDVTTEMGVQGGEMETVEALYQSLSAGMSESADKQEKFLRTSQALARVGKTDLATTVDVLTTTINAYGMSMDDAGSVANSLFATVEQGKVRMDELASVMGRVYSISSTLGAPIDEVNGAMAELTANGFSAQNAGTSLRAMMRSIMKPSEDMQQALFDIALEEGHLSGETEDLVSTMDSKTDRIETLKSDVAELEQELWNLNQTQHELNMEMGENSIEMMEIRHEAMKEDRDLTEEEKEKIEELKEEQLGLRIEHKKAEQQRKDKQNEMEKNKRAIEDEEEALERLQKQLEANKTGVGETVVAEQGLIETMQDLQDWTDENDKSMTDLFTRSRALRGALVLLDDSGQGWSETAEKVAKKGELTAENLKEMRDSGELTKEEYEEMRGVLQMYNEDMDDTLETDFVNFWNQVKIAVSELSMTMAADLQPQLKAGQEMLKDLTVWFQTMEKDTRKQISAFAALATGLLLLSGPLLLIGGQLALIAMAGTSLLIPMLAILLPLLGGAAYAYSELSEEGDVLESSTSSMGSAFGFLVDIFRGIGNVISDTVYPALVSIGEGIFAVIDFFGQFTDNAKRVADVLSDELGDTLTGLGYAITLLSNDFEEEWGSAGEMFTTSAEDIASAIEDDLIWAIRAFFTAVQKTIRTVTVWWLEHSDEVIPVVKAMGRAIEDWLIDNIDKLKRAVKIAGVTIIAAWVGIGNVIGTALSLLLPLFARVASGVWGVMGAARGLAAILRGIATAALSFVARFIPLQAAIHIATRAVASFTAKILTLGGIIGGFIRTVAIFLTRFRGLRFLVVAVDKVLTGLVLRLSSLSSVAGGILGLLSRLGGKFRGISIALGPVARLLPKVGFLLLRLMSPLGLIIAAVGVLAYAWEENWFGIRRITSKVVDKIQGIIRRFFGKTGEDTSTFLARLKMLWRKYLLPIWRNVKRIFLKISGVVKRVLNFLVNEFIKPLLRDLAALWELHTNTIEDETVSTFKTIKRIVMTVLRRVKRFWNKHKEEIIAIVRFLLDFLRTIITTGFDLIMTIIRTAMAIIRGDWERAWNLIKGFLKRTLQRLWELFKSFVKNIVPLFRAFFGWVKNNWRSWLRTLWNLLIRLGNEILETLGEFWRLTKKGFGLLFDWVGENWKGWLRGLVQAFIRWGSRLVELVFELRRKSHNAFYRLFDWVGENWEDWLKGLKQTFIDIGNGILEKARALGDFLIEAFEVAWDEANEETDGGLNDMKDAIVEEGKKIKNKAENVANNVYEHLAPGHGKGVPDLVGAGEDIIGQIGEGIDNEVSNLQDKVDNAADKIPDWMKPGSPTEEGPMSKTGPKEMGELIIGQYAEGMESEVKAVEKSLTRMSQGVFNTLDGSTLSSRMTVDEQRAAGPRPGETAGEDKSITISDRAIVFESGAIQAEDGGELSDEVKQAVRESLDEVVDDMRGRGRSNVTR